MARADKQDRPATTGVLVIDKPPGRSSMSAVAEVRRKAGGVKTGHAGTLDPLATGVLVVALGRATKIIDRLMATDKRYQTVIDLSAFTTTDDTEGEREEIAIATPPDETDIRAALERFTGTFEQRPPAFSAMKVGGRRAYKLARKGEQPKIPARPVTMHALALVSYDWPRLELDLHCGKGLYVRSLARDLGAVLGTGGHCLTIRRTAVGPFTLEMAVELDDLPTPLTDHHLIAIADALALIDAQPRQFTI
jgi:tRNA pseudouridine55 synthase